MCRAVWKGPPASWVGRWNQSKKSPRYRVGNLRVLRALTCFGAQQIPPATGGLMEPNKKVVKEKGWLKRKGFY